MEWCCLRVSRASRAKSVIDLCFAKWEKLWSASRSSSSEVGRIEIEASKLEKNNAMPAAPYFPPKDADFDPWMNNFRTLIAADPTDYGLVAADATIITAAYNLWHPAYVLATDPSTRTTPTVAAKTAARVSCESTVRPYAQRISKNSGLDPDLILGLGLNLPNATRPPIPAPTTAPVLVFIAATMLRHSIGYKDTNLGGTKKKPVGSIGVEVWRSVGTVAATDPAQCAYYQTWTKSPNSSDFTADQRGKVCTYFARYTTKGGPAGKAQAGPWSDALSVIVV